MPKHQFNYSKLLGAIKTNFGTQEKFAKAMGMSIGTLSGKLNGNYPFTQDEIYEACLLLKIDLKEDAADYFFSSKS